MKNNNRVNYISAKIASTSRQAVIIVNKSLKHLEAYIKVSDVVVGSASTKSKEFQGLDTKEKVRLLAKKIANIAQKNNIKNAVYHRNGKKYTGNIQQLADAIREEKIVI